MFSSSYPLQGGSLTGRFVRHSLASKHLAGERGITVRLPDNYDPQNHAYPVVYLQDGQNMFDRRTGFLGQEWGVDEVVAKLTQQGQLPEAIYVAVDHGPDRTGDYTHVKDPEHGGGKGKDYQNFLLNEVLPAVEASYSINPRHRVLLGSSLGGLATTAIGLAHPALFAALGAMSWSAWWADGQIADQILSMPLDNAAKPRIWMDMGTEEGGSDRGGQRSIEGKKMGPRPAQPNGLQDVRDATREAATALLHKGWVLDDNLRYHEPLGGKHTEGSWNERLDQVLPWLMKGMSTVAVKTP